MQYINTIASASSTVIDPSIAGIRWLEAQNRATEQHRSLFRRVHHEQEMEMMSRPLEVQRAYELFGLMLGTLPPAVIFFKIFGYGGFRTGDFHELGVGLVFLCLMMNLICALMGFVMGRALANAALISERRSWTEMVVVLALLGVAWGIVTGASGGIFFFGFGSIVGAIFAIPIGIVAFLMFGALHRMMERGGMIEAKHFLPIATGITVVISTLIAVA